MPKTLRSKRKVWGKPKRDGKKKDEGVVLGVMVSGRWQGDVPPINITARPSLYLPTASPSLSYTSSIISQANHKIAQVPRLITMLIRIADK